MINEHMIVKFIMKLRESKITFDASTGAVFQQLFNHPDYLILDKDKQMELGLEWAENLYQHGAEHSSFDFCLGNVDTLIERSTGGTILDIGCYIGGKTIKWFEEKQVKISYNLDI